MATFEDAVRVTAGWPAITVDTWYGTPGIKVGGKGFCRVWSQREHDRDDVHDTAVLVVMVDIDEKPALINTSPGVLFSTPHYDGYGSMLIRLGTVSLDDLAGHLEESYLIKATPKIRAAFTEALAP